MQLFPLSFATIESFSSIIWCVFSPQLQSMLLINYKHEKSKKARRSRCTKEEGPSSTGTKIIRRHRAQLHLQVVYLIDLNMVLKSRTLRARASIAID